MLDLAANCGRLSELCSDHGRPSFMLFAEESATNQTGSRGRDEKGQDGVTPGDSGQTRLPHIIKSVRRSGGYFVCHESPVTNLLETRLPCGNEFRSRSGQSATRRRFAKPHTGRSCRLCLGRVELQVKSQRLRQ